jgi:hypothetical protein
MGRKKVYAMIASLVAVAAVALLLGFVVIPGSSTGTLSTTVTASSGNPSEGIVVHGYWTVDVFNPDGSLAEHREFENTFIEAGKDLFTDIIARQSVPGRWSIVFGGTPTHPCLENGKDVLCNIGEVNETIVSTALFKNLTVTKTGGGNTAVLMLSGSATIANATNISLVATNLGFCGGSFSPAECANAVSYGATYQITYAEVSPKIAVQAGQIVQVTVKISFEA